MGSLQQELSQWVGHCGERHVECSPDLLHTQLSFGFLRGRSVHPLGKPRMSFRPSAVRDTQLLTVMSVREVKVGDSPLYHTRILPSLTPAWAGHSRTGVGGRDTRGGG
ncbi:hypothetical protein Pcinc_029200 [Petrolisthes cinctipes]|uniref:Uncharacterized protein n=1 Tax=Petrolisthes cinctipes TaxID=88211 RepID=A0AAE1F1F1_PETCI|nr:hypothetical protein Pcinc_029200 [Petrolisthes cinctipes]